MAVKLIKYYFIGLRRTTGGQKKNSRGTKHEQQKYDRGPTPN